MKEKMKYILLGVVFLVLAFFAPTMLAGKIVYIYLIPLNSTVMTCLFAAAGVLFIVAGIFTKKK